MFQLAREAADRGLASLAPGEAEELRALERELLGDPQSHGGGARQGVRPDPRAARDLPVREPPRDGARRARARALPPERLERLQALTHKAVSAGIESPEGSASSE